MAYSSPTQVAVLTQDTYDDSTKPLTSAAVVSQIAIADAEIDSILLMFSLSVPATVPAAILETSRLLGAAYVEEAVFTGQSRNRSENAELWRARALGKNYDENGALSRGSTLGRWIRQQRGASSVRSQSELTETNSENSPLTTRDDMV